VEKKLFNIKYSQNTKKNFTKGNFTHAQLSFLIDINKNKIEKKTLIKLTNTGPDKKNIGKNKIQ
jgi:hypothetical protein